MNESSSDDDDNESHSSLPNPNDMSIAHSVTEDSHPVPVITVSTDTAATIPTSGQNQHQDAKENDILESMSSYQDMKFLIKSLREQAQNAHRRGGSAFGGGQNASWTVYLPAAWHSERRNAFLQWITQQFQFAPRPLGNAVSVLQISKTRGQVVLARLEDALLAHKKKEIEELEDQQAILPETPQVSMLSPHHLPQTTMESRGAVVAPVLSPAGLLHTHSRNVPSSEDEGTSALAAGLQTLSLERQVVERNKKRESDVSLHVGEDFVETVAGDLRPSMEHSMVGATDLMLHLHGGSSDHEEEDGDEDPTDAGDLSDEELAKLPKLSISSTNTTSMGRLSAPHPIQTTLEVIETYVLHKMKHIYRQHVPL